MSSAIDDDPELDPDLEAGYEYVYEYVEVSEDEVTDDDQRPDEPPVEETAPEEHADHELAEDEQAEDGPATGPEPRSDAAESEVVESDVVESDVVESDVAQSGAAGPERRRSERRGSERRAGARRGSARTRGVVLALVTVTALVASGVLTNHVWTTLSTSTAAADRHVMKAAATGAAADSAAAVAAIERDRRATADTARQAADTDAASAGATREQLLAQIEELGRTIEATEAELQAASLTNLSQTVSFVGLQACLQGIRMASLAGLAGNDDIGIAQLRSVEQVCRATAQSLGVGGTSGFAFDFADPFVVQVGDTYYGYATNAGAGAVQLIQSSDLDEWTLVGEALSSVPSWAERGKTWSPSVARIGFGWVLYYTVRERGSGLQCISSAFALAPTGPFEDDSTEPLICQRDLGGSIDPSPYVEEIDGKEVVHLLWKSDGVVRGRVARLWSVPLDESGRGLGWFPVEVARADRDWEARVIEGPTLTKHDGTYYLFYSGNDWGTTAYATGYATCTTPLGPCTKPPDNIVLASRGTQSGTGGAEVFSTRFGDRVVYHAWEGSDIGYPNARRVHTAALAFTASGRPIIGDPPPAPAGAPAPAP